MKDTGDDPSFRNMTCDEAVRMQLRWVTVGVLYACSGWTENRMPVIPWTPPFFPSPAVTQSSQEGGEPPGVTLNDMGPSGQQHMSLSKTVVLRAHQIEPFAQAMKEAVTSSKRFTLSIVGGYDVLVNEDKTRSFVCLRVRAGRPQVLQLIDKVDPVMRMFKQPLYYKDPIVHISIASVPGDLGYLVGSSSEAEGSGSSEATTKARSLAPETGDGDGDESDSEEEHDGVPREVYVVVTSVAFKAGKTVVEAPLVVDVDV